MTLKDLAEDVGQPHHTVYQYVRAQGLQLQPWGERDYTVPALTVLHLSEPHARQAACTDGRCRCRSPPPH